MKKNELLEDIINSSLCGQLDLMFGDGSYVKVTHLSSRSKEIYGSRQFIYFKY